jgi:hypothetical protein
MDAAASTPSADSGAPLDATPEPASGALTQPPAETAPPARHDDCTFAQSPTQLATYAGIAPTAWTVEVDDRYAYYTERLQVGCVLLPPLGACNEQSALRRVPRCGGLAEDMGAPFDGATSLELGGDFLYVLARRGGLFRLDLNAATRERLAIDPTCVSSFAANESQLIVFDQCESTLLRLARGSTQFETIAKPSAAAWLAVTATIAYFISTEGIEWVALDSGASGFLTREVTDATAVQLAADAHAVVALWRLAGQVQLQRFPLDGSPAQAWPAEAIGVLPLMHVADGFIYFLQAAPPDESSSIMRLPTSGMAPPQRIVDNVLPRDIAAYGERVYFTNQGVVLTAAP